MRLRQSLNNLIKSGLLFSLPFCLNLLGCLPEPLSYTYNLQDIPEAIQDICLKEYNFKVVVRLLEDTLWIYLPTEDLFSTLEKKEKPTKYIERFEIEENKGTFQNKRIKIEYLIKPIPEEEKYQEYKYNKAVLEKINNVLTVLRRVIFSLDKKSQSEPKFYYLVVADIKNGFEIREIIYYLDLKKVSYSFISLDEFQHRSPHEVSFNPGIIGDSEGLYLNYQNITLEEFISQQILYRIKLKFSKPEVTKDVDIDEEIKKIVAYTLKIYNFKDFQEIELHNLFTNYKVILNQQAILTSTPE